MNHAALTITRIYQFASEVILIYLLAVPLFFVFHLQYSFWDYFLLVGVQLAAGLLIVRFTPVIGAFIGLAAIITVLAATFFPIPWLVAIMTGAVFCWRFLKHQEDADHQHEITVLGLSFFLLSIYLLLSNDHVFLAIALVQFLLVLTGYLLRNIVSMEKDRGFGVSVISGTVGVFVLAGLVIAALYNGFRSVYLLVGRILSYLAGGTVEALLGPFNMEMEWQENERNGNNVVEDQGASDPIKNPPEDLNGEAMNRVFHLIEWVLIIGAIVVVIWIVLKIYRKRMPVEAADNSYSMVTYETIPHEDRRKGWRFFKRKKPEMDN
ncbi:hypothetical protein [Virgibacillus senegalensis]|uniref:hypothetical protein n=1 Tax=Virgibacillus senegalensis TaxID=1499679 RepID=UPI00069E862E|nr:hypothetical protein [Virgibacillus senegalensis]